MEKYPDSFKKRSVIESRMGRVYAGPEPAPEPAVIEDVYNGPSPGPDPEPKPGPEPKPRPEPGPGPGPEIMAPVYAGPVPNPVKPDLSAMEGVYAGPDPAGMNMAYAGPEMMNGGIGGIGMTAVKNDQAPDDTIFECVYAGPEMMGGGFGGVLRNAEKEPEKKHRGIRGIFGKKKE